MPPKAGFTLLQHKRLALFPPELQLPKQAVVLDEIRNLMEFFGTSMEVTKHVEGQADLGGVFAGINLERSTLQGERGPP